MLGVMVRRPDVVFLEGLDFFTQVTVQARPPDWERSSPCAGWRALDVVGHVGTAVRYGTALLRGAAPTWRPMDPPGDAVGGDPTTWWATIAGPAHDAVGGVDLDRTVEGPMGPRTVGDGLAFPALDLFVHAWDLARSIGTSVVIPRDVIQFGHARVGAIPARQVRSAGVFADEVDPPAGATDSDSFIAWTGRDPRWTSK
jgi:uncharacterized protein (TIGR03086 family)